MSIHNAQSQSASGSETARSDATPLTSNPSIDARTTACERLVEDAVERDLSAAVLADSLKDLGLKAIEAIDYIDEFKQRVEIQRSKARKRNSPPHNLSPEAKGIPQSQEDRDRAVEEAAWASLRAKLESDSVSHAVPSDLSLNALDRMFELFSQEVSPPSSLLKSVLAVAPHLADDDDFVFENPHLNEMQKCKIAYTNQKPFENLIIRHRDEGFYVDFEKFYVTLDPGYNPNNKAKDLNEKFTLLERNSISLKHSIITEAEWMRLYDAWVDAVLLFYPHQKAELSSYRDLIVNMFQATSSPFPAIKYDHNSCERYARQPYCLDSCKDTLPFPLLSQLLSSSHVGSVPSSSPSKKRAIVTYEGPLVRAIRAVLAVGTTSAVNVVDLIEPKTKASVKQPSTDDVSTREQHQLEAAGRKAQEARSTGTRQLKWKADEFISEVPPTETAHPLASPPLHLLDDPDIQSMLHTLRDYIRVETPFNVDGFEAMLYDHPNQLFVKSVMNSLRYGFWPFDEGNWEDNHDNTIQNYASEQADMEAIRSFRDDEIEARRWSEPLRSNTLLPGMKISPIFVIWQKAKVRYDDMRTFGQVIYNAKRAFPREPLVIWKSDVSSTFLNLPAHPIYQLRQVIDVEGVWRLVHCLVFGNRASPHSHCWCSVSGLMCWIGIKKLDIKDLHDFMDDFFSWARASDLVLYKGVSRPHPQARLLMLWDKIGCPWRDKKQEFGMELKIIGFYVDINNGTLTLADEAIADIIKAVCAFLATPGRRPPL
ncbi:hypothetical protein BYT27DRAFT_7258470 [Phlegmacium glaucopus]|nr:hypothetical protein BYT27DRAFT_7258470 [Phlegmacium glaucopus]